MMKKHFKQKKGFAMLFTVLIVSLILAIALSISNISYKQKVLSSLANDSQIALYQADAGLECGYYYYETMGLFPAGTKAADAPGEIYCGDKVLRYDGSQSADDFFVYKESVASTTAACVSIVFDRTNVSGETVVEARGYNMCAENPRQVERALEIRY